RQLQTIAVIRDAVPVKCNGEDVVVFRTPTHGETNLAAVAEGEFVGILLPGLELRRSGRRAVRIDTDKGGTSRHGEVAGSGVVGQVYGQGRVQRGRVDRAVGALQIGLADHTGAAILRVGLGPYGSGEGQFIRLVENCTYVRRAPSRRLQQEYVALACLAK